MLVLPEQDAKVALARAGQLRQSEPQAVWRLQLSQPFCALPSRFLKPALHVGEQAVAAVVVFPVQDVAAALVTAQARQSVPQAPEVLQASHPLAPLASVFL